MISYNNGNASQSSKNLNELLTHLVDPINHEKLICEKSDDSSTQLLSEKSKKVYPLKRNIPCFLDSSLAFLFSEDKSHNEKLWNELQESEFLASQTEPRLSFSIDEDNLTAEISEFMREFEFNGLCLDIGCGVVPFPSYMKNVKDVIFMGIDPYFGDFEREFPFAQGISELLPFEDNCFDGVLFATSLDHVIEPVLSLKESFRVLKHNGMIFIWYYNRKIDLSYIIWKIGIRKKVDIHHIWCFRDAFLAKLVRKAGFKNISIKRFKNHHRNHLLIAKKTVV